jgi:c-di-GMP phosphodiesterase
MPTSTEALRIARQPILDRKGEVVGYELLYRAAGAATAAGADARTMTMGSLQALVEMGLENIVGAHKAFYNADFSVLDFSIFETLSKEQIVIEILEQTEPTPENLALAAELKKKGYVLALDDYAFQPHLEPFLEFVEIVKLECSELDPKKDRGRILALMSRRKKVLAEKLENMAEYQAYYNLGCHLFQGYYFAKPAVVEGTAVPTQKKTLLNFLSKIHREDVSIRELEESIASDPNFAYKLLRQVHSAAVGASNIETVGQAILFLGIRPTAALASVLALSAVDDKPRELLVTALTRAKMAEELARSAGLGQPDAFFTLGLLSVLDAYLNQPMERITEMLPLGESLKSALLEQNPDDGLVRAIRCVRACEQGDFATADALGFQPKDVQRSYGRAIAFADEMKSVL